MRFRSRGVSAGQQIIRNQRRLTMIVAGVGLVWILLTISSRSGWVTAIFTDPQAAPKPVAVPESLMGSSALRPDEFEVVPNDASGVADDYAAMIDRKAAASMEMDAQVTDRVATVPSALTGLIRDDVLGVLSSESDAWFGTLRLAERISPSSHSLIPEGQFPLFMDSPHSCRGRAFVIRGQLRRLSRAPLPPGAETFGVRSAYDAWISTRDSGNQLVHVVALSADAGLPVAENMGKEPPEVEVAGYFFKREGYAARGRDGSGDLALAPLILAGRLRHLPKQMVVTRDKQMTPWLTWIGIAICLGVLALVWQFHLSDRAFRGTRTHQLTSLPVRPSFEGVQVLTVEQALREMQEHAEKTSPNTSLLSGNNSF